MLGYPPHALREMFALENRISHEYIFTGYEVTGIVSSIMLYRDMCMC
jgi:hypothetical protein